ELPGSKAEEPKETGAVKLRGNKAEESNDTSGGERPANKTDESAKAGTGKSIDNEDETAARDGLNKINEKIAEMVAARKKELEQGITDTRIRLSVVKSVNDQFNFILKISEDLVKSLRA